VYAVNAVDTYNRAKQWVKELQRQASPNIVIALAGNKADVVALEPKKRQVSEEEAKSYSEENGLLFMETSAKTNQNVAEIFEAIAKKLPKNEGQARKKVDVNDTPPTTKRGCC